VIKVFFPIKLTKDKRQINTQNPKSKTNYPFKINQAKIHLYKTNMS